MPEIHNPAPALLIAALLLAGCMGASVDPAALADEAAAALARIELLPDAGGMRVQQGVDIILVGFPEGVADALAARLAPEEIAHVGYSNPRGFPPPRTMAVDGDLFPAPFVAVAEYDVHALAPEAAAAFFAGLAADEDGYLDANAAEGALVAAATEAGFLHEGRPAMVILHAGDALPDDHLWRFTYTHGPLSGVRAFGEREGVLVFDVSAPEDPGVTQGVPGEDLLPVPLIGSPPSTKAYNYPLAAEGDATLDALRELIVDASHYRLLKGPLYPASTASCTHVTLVLAVDMTSATDALFRSAETWVDAAALEAGYENLTREDVLVDFKIMRMPVDDPVLSTLARGGSALATIDAMRWYIDENFDRFVDAVPPCEEYLAFNFFADSTMSYAVASGYATYDVTVGHRIAFGFLPDWWRIVDSCIDDSRGRPAVLPSQNVRCNGVNYLFAHEVGHLFGLRHTQQKPATYDAQTGAMGPSESSESFTSVWSTMGYRPGERLHDFGVMDQGQFARNRAGMAIQQAQKLGLEGTPQFVAALDAFARYDWNAGAQILAPLLAPARESHERIDGPRWSWSEDLSALFSEEEHEEH